MTDHARAASYRILVVEDEEYLRDLYHQVLSEAGYEVDVAKNGEEALEKMTGTYDLVLLDVILPKMDGLQVLDTLAKRGVKSTNRIVLLSNLGQDLIIAKATEYGVRGYMVKSNYTPDQLVREVGGYVRDEEVASQL